MIAVYIILAASPILLLTAVAFLALIVVGIRKGDGALHSPASNRLDAITRRVVGVGVRNDAGNEEGES